MRWRYKAVNIFFLIMVLAGFASGCFYLAFSFVSFSVLKDFISARFPYENNFFTEVRFNRIVNGSRLIGSLLITSTITLFIVREHVKQYFYNILSSFGPLFKTTEDHFVVALKNEDKLHISVLLFVLLAAIVNRLIFLFQPMRYDESATFTGYAAKPFYYGLSNYSAPNNHLFHTLLVHISWLLFGDSPWAIRLPAFIAGVMIIPATYIVIRMFYNKNAALLSAGVVASSSFLIEYSTNARGYTIVTLIFLLIIILSTYLSRSTNPAAWFLFAVLSALGFYTIPIMLYPFGIVVVWLLVTIIIRQVELSRKLLLKQFLIAVFIVALLTLVLYTPVLAASGWRSITSNQFVKSKTLLSFFSQLPFTLASTWGFWNRDLPVIVSGFLVAGFVVALIFHKNTSAYRMSIVLAAILWVVPILLLQRVVPFQRVWLFLLPLYLGIASTGLSYIAKYAITSLEHRTDIFAFRHRWSNYKSLTFSVFVIVLTVWLSANVIQTKSILFSEETGTLRDAEAITLLLRGLLKDGDKIVAAVPSDEPLAYYFYVYHLPDTYLTIDSKANLCNHAFIVVNKSQNQDVNDVLDSTGVSRPLQTDYRLIKDYESGSVYESKC